MAVAGQPTSFVLTLTGSIQNVATVVGYDMAAHTVWISADDANTHAFWLAFGVNTPATTGVRIPAPVTGEPAAPWDPVEGTPIDYLALSDIYVIGTNAEKVRFNLVGLRGAAARM